MVFARAGYSTTCVCHPVCCCMCLQRDSKRLALCLSNDAQEQLVAVVHKSSFLCTCAPLKLAHAFGGPQQAMQQHHLWLPAGLDCLLGLSPMFGLDWTICCRRDTAFGCLLGWNWAFCCRRSLLRSWWHHGHAADDAYLERFLGQKLTLSAR